MERSIFRIVSLKSVRNQILPEMKKNAINEFFFSLSFRTSIDSSGQSYKSFYGRNLRVFVISLFLSSLFMGKARGLPQCGTPERCFTRVGLSYQSLSQSVCTKHFQPSLTFASKGGAQIFIPHYIIIHQRLTLLTNVRLG